MDRRVIRALVEAFLHTRRGRWTVLADLVRQRCACTREEADLLVDALAVDRYVRVGEGPDPLLRLGPTLGMDTPRAPQSAGAA